jgi:signal transduction histidine kinase
MAALARSPAVLLAVAVTAIFALVDALHFTYYAPELRIVLETVTALGALLAAAVVFGRFRRSGTQSELWLIFALALLGAASVLVAAFVAIESAPRPVLVVAIASRLVGAWALAASAYVPATPLRTPRRTVTIGVAGVVALVGLLTLGFVASISDAGGMDLQRLADAGIPHPSVIPELAGFHGLTLAGFLLAALGYVRLYGRTRDGFYYWIAVAAVLAATARMHYLLAAPAGKYWLHTGDVFVLLSYCALLFGAVKEILSYWQRSAETAVLEERRRIARELHDSVAQELAFIARRSRRRGLGPADVAQISAAAERALNDSRRAIAALTRPLDEPLDLALAQAAEDVAARTGAALSLDLEPGIVVAEPRTREELVRIACEAVANAARHSAATTVRVELRNGDRIRLRVVDDGVGFDLGSATPDGAGRFGLVSMRERAAALGADFDIRSGPGTGTAVEVTL